MLPVQTYAAHLPEEAARADRRGFGAVGRFCRVVSSVAGGWLLGSSFGVLPGIVGGLVGMGVFAFAEHVARR